MSINFGFAGVPSTGKTFFFSKLNQRLNDKITCIPEVTRSDVFTYCNLPSVDLSKASNNIREKFATGLIDYQQNLEFNCNGKGFMVDSALPVSLMYLLFNSMTFSDRDIRKTVDEVINHVNKKYHVIFYLPFGRCQIENAPHRIHTNHFTLECMDSVLQKILGWLNVDIVTVRGSRSSSESIIYSEIRRRGLQC